MVTRFGSRAICDVTFKAAYNDQRVGNRTFKAGQPVFVIDTATASSLEQGSTVVYAYGGKGYNRLVSWEGEKTMTFTVTDALMSPMGLAVLTNAGFAGEGAVKHVHVTYDVALDGTGKGSIKFEELAEELGVPATVNSIDICVDTQLKPYATVLDVNGAIIDWVSDSDIIVNTTVTGGLATIKAKSNFDFTIATAKEKTVKLDFYVAMTTGATEIKIGPEDFGGFFYVEADTLYRNQSGRDMAATLTFPKVKIQSGFTMSMSANGDPSTFDFTMDAFPAYTYFDSTKKVVCDITIISGDSSTENGIMHSSPVDHGKATQ